MQSGVKSTRAWLSFQWCMGNHSNSDLPTYPEQFGPHQPQVVVETVHVEVGSDHHEHLLAWSLDELLGRGVMCPTASAMASHCLVIGSCGGARDV